GSKGRIIEARSHLARISEPAIGLVDAEQQSTESVARSFWIGEPAHHHFLALQALHLLPCGSPSRLVAQVASLRHHAFEPEAAPLIEERRGWHGEMLAVFD